MKNRKQCKRKISRRNIPQSQKKNFEWTISGVKNKISQKESTFSDPFYVGLYKFQGCIKCDEIKDYVTIFLNIMKGEWDDALRWPIKYK